jgi:hypothetical protein
VGWARMLLLGNLGQQLDIHDARNELDRVRRASGMGAVKDAEQDEQIQRLIDQNEQSTLCLVTLVRLLIAKGVVAPAEVQELLAVLDPPEPASAGNAVDPTSEDLLALAEAARRLKPG